MSDNLPEVRRPEPTREIARTDTDSWTNVFADVVELARGIADTEFVPRGLRGNIAATTAAMLYGREVGLPPMTALNSTHVIEGKPSIAAEAMRAMVLAAGHDIEVLESTGSICRMRARRRGTERWTPEVVWTLDMARAADLTGKNNWKRHPRRMLQARATSELCELYFPDVVMGFRSVEEMQDEAEIAEAAPAPTEQPTRVARKRTTRKAAASKPAPAAQRPAEEPAMDGPPLPGEPGYDDDASSSPAAAVAAETSAGGSPEGEAEGSPADTETSGEDAGPGVAAPARETPSDAPLSVGSDGSSPEPDDDGIVDAELVDDEAPEDRVDRGRPSTRAQHRMLFATLGERFDITGDEDRYRVASALVGRPIDSFNRLTKVEASQLVDSLAMLPDRAALDALVEAAEEQQ